MQKKIADFEYPTLNPHIECNTYYLFMTTENSRLLSTSKREFFDYSSVSFHAAASHPASRSLEN